MSAAFAMMLAICASIFAPYSVQLTHAQSVVLIDCQGFTRAVKSVDTGAPSKVEVQVQEAGGAGANGQPVTLTNTVSGQVYTSSATNGVAAFGEVAPGIYTIGAPSNLTIGEISIGSLFGAGAAGAAAGGAVLIGGGAVAGAAIAADHIANGSDSNNDNEGSAPTPTPKPQVTSTPQPTPTRPPVQTPDCSQCDPDARPTPVTPFVGKPAAAFFQATPEADLGNCDPRVRGSRDCFVGTNDSVAKLSPSS